jgi:hypothetical protein
MTAEREAMTPVIDLGDDHTLTLQMFEGEISACTIEHKKKDGTPCNGFIPFTGRAWARSFDNHITSWEVVSESPLTLSPSVQCRICGDHGFVRGGKWVRA